MARLGQGPPTGAPLGHWGTPLATLSPGLASGGDEEALAEAKRRSMSPPQIPFWMPSWWRFGTWGMKPTVVGSRPGLVSGQVRAAAAEAGRRSTVYQQDLL